MAFIGIVTHWGFILRLDREKYLRQNIKQYHVKVLLRSFQLIGHTTELDPSLLEYY